MNFPARLTRRFAVGSVALAAVAASFAFTTGSARAATSTCLDANAQQVYDTGAIVQWTCSVTGPDADPYQAWKVLPVPSNPNVPSGSKLFQLENWGALNGNGAADCLDANAQQIYDGGKITQWGCDASDPFQVWMVVQVSGNDMLENYGAYLEGKLDCVDANAQQDYNGGEITQYACNTSDPYQQWHGVLEVVGNQALLGFENVGT